MEIRKIENKDIKKIAALAVAEMTPQFKKVGEKFLNKKQYAEKLSEALENMEFGVVAEDNGNIIGFAHWYYEDNRAFIEDLVVNPKTNKKHDAALLRFIMRTCKKDKIDSISYLLPHGSKYVELAKKFDLKPVSIELKKELK